MLDINGESGASWNLNQQSKQNMGKAGCFVNLRNRINKGEFN
jgi:hypothetical protein